MAVQYMNSVSIDTYDNAIGGKNSKAWQLEDELSEVAVGEWILIPNNIKFVSSQLVFSNTATAKVQYTCSPVEDVIADTAIANDSVSGAVSANTFEKFDTITAIRLNVTAYTSGTIKLQLRAQ